MSAKQQRAIWDSANLSTLAHQMINVLQWSVQNWSILTEVCNMEPSYTLTSKTLPFYSGYQEVAALLIRKQLPLSWNSSHLSLRCLLTAAHPLFGSIDIETEGPCVMVAANMLCMWKPVIWGESAFKWHNVTKPFVGWTDNENISTQRETSALFRYPQSTPPRALTHTLRRINYSWG